ncbi:phosphatase activator [Dendrothele bispora CBS 962.96]|uniref:Phosphatase activator n=1 Tax=Dendrothele bispora (strain CBS 962.96) TaxID=1314807 RepID=A0A4S8LAY8_DENBC|nr:phosphatase activator [Dendrothele bispora CBS 962.96]
MATVSLPSSSSPITQVSQTPAHVNFSHQPALLTRLLLDLRGKRFEVDRETIMNLPESVLLCLFPNGLVLSRQSMVVDGNGEEEEEDVYAVDFDPDCFQFVLNFFRTASENFYGTDTTPGLYAAQQHLQESFSSSSDGSYGMANSAPSQNPLISKQAIIVLREELDYFAIPGKESVDSSDKGVNGIGGSSGEIKTDEHGIASEGLNKVKRRCGEYLMEKKNIFTALQRNVNKENNVAEQHLIDMLCMSGFNREDEWGFRALEPSRCCISSIALVLLKTGITHHPHSPDGDETASVEIDYAQMATSQKLLLFWRKPARKCWWDGLEIELPEKMSDDGGMLEPKMNVKLWARRVWTLELSLI